MSSICKNLLLEKVSFQQKVSNAYNERRHGI